MAMGRFVPLAVAAAASAARAEKAGDQDASIIGEFERPGLNFILTTFFIKLDYIAELGSLVNRKRLHIRNHVCGARLTYDNKVFLYCYTSSSFHFCIISHELTNILFKQS